MNISLDKKLTRLLVSIDPIAGELSLQAQWTDVISTGQGEVSAAIPQSLVSTNYSSLEDADQRAIAFPAFPAIADRFSSEPFTAIADLLEALRELQALEEQERLAQLALGRPQEPPFEGAP